MISFFAVEELGGEEAKELPVLLGPFAVMMSYPTRMHLCASWCITLGWGLCKRVFASDSARRDWWRSRSVQTGAGNALLLWKKLFHTALLQMSLVVLSRQVLWQVLVLYQLQQEVRTPPAHLLTEAIAVVRKYASSCYLLRRAGLFSPFLSSPSAPQHTHHCLCLPFFFCWQWMLLIYSCLEETFENSNLPFNLISAGS